MVYKERGVYGVLERVLDDIHESRVYTNLDGHMVVGVLRPPYRTYTLVLSDERHFF